MLLLGKLLSPFGFLSAFSILAIDLKSAGKHDGFLYRLSTFFGFLGLLPLALALLNLGLSFALLPGTIILFPGAGWWLLSTIAGAAGMILFLRTGSAALDRVKNRLTSKTALERNRKTDVREIGKFLPPEIGQFDPRKLFTDRDGLLVGLDEQRQPVRLDYEAWKISHVLLSGRTRSGKGVAAQILLSQAIRRGEYVVVLDPKVDNWMPHIFKDTCNSAGRPYHFLDLRQSAGPQCNPFAGCDEETLENMLIGGFSLTEKGEAADFYRLADRKAARDCARWLAQHPGSTARDAVLMDAERAAEEESDGGWARTAPAFHSYMLEMAELPAVNRPAAAPGSIDIAAGEQTGGCLYVVGDMINPRIIRMQRMILLRLLFLAKNRDQLAQNRTITVFADEFKVHISRPFMTSLGASAGWGLHTILAFQSLQDLADCPADLDKDAVRGSVMENCGIQLSYAIKDPETAEWLAASTGTVLVDDESRRVNKNIALQEKIDSERTLRQADRYLIDVNMLMNLPKGCGALAVAGQLARFCYTSPVPAERTPAATTPTAAPMPAMPAGASGGGQPQPARSLAAEALDLNEPEPAEPEAEAAEDLPEPEPAEPQPPVGGAAALDLDDELP
ncbi:MAG: type IV secretory system conjugative DNA transfer family protein [Burkholderiales bacterium]|nr:type IV secretory system conjugative DNA transfer family protein [Burkholderiales bacterium]